jgi:hypothetical protein
MRKLMTAVIVMSALIGSAAFADDSSTVAESVNTQNSWGRDKATINDGNKAKVVDLVDSIFREDTGLAGTTNPAAGQMDQSSVSTQE